MTLRSVYNMWLGIIFMVVSKFVAALLPGTLAVFQSFTALRFSLPLLFQLCHAGLFWKCVSTKVSYATLA